MSAWGTGLFSDDTTCDVRDSYINNLKAGLSDSKATEDILNRFHELMSDTQVACLVYFALADTQWRYGRLDPRVKKQALDLLYSGGDVSVWVRDAPGDAAARRKVLTALTQRLEGEPRPRRSIKIAIPKPLKKRTDAEHGTVFLLPLPFQKFAALVLVGHCDTGYKTMEPVFRVLKWLGKPCPTVDELHDRNFVALEGGTLGTTQEIGFFLSGAKQNPIAVFIRTNFVFPYAPLYSGQGTFMFKEGLIAQIEAALGGNDR